MAYKSIKTTTLRDNFAVATAQVQNDQFLVITKNNRPVSALVDIDYFEDLLTVTNPKIIKSIEEARASKKRYTHEEVFGDLA
jgi:PHD/YefM family antitoxin component YafN of YafNO toxin-antitoxin module